MTFEDIREGAVSGKYRTAKGLTNDKLFFKDLREVVERELGRKMPTLAWQGFETEIFNYAKWEEGGRQAAFYAETWTGIIKQCCHNYCNLTLDERIQQELDKPGKPTNVIKLIPLFVKFKELPDNSVGGYLHIVIDDGNIENSHIQCCLGTAEENEDTTAALLAKLLLKMSKTQRLKIYENC